MGSYNAFPLQRGVDCPAEAHYAPAFGKHDVYAAPSPGRLRSWMLR